MGLTSEQASGSGHNFDCLQVPGSSNKSPPLRCPRCDSDNTKFCYYNNYNRLQPRHFCKACRRYWTAGGTLRSVPVGGARKSKQPKTTSSTTTTSSSSTKTTQTAFATFTDTLLESTPFHDMYPHALFYPPYVTTDQVGNRSSGCPHAPLLVPTSSSSSHGTQSTRGSTTNDDALLHLMPDSDQTSTWLQDPPPLPASYYWNWWDDAFDSIVPGPDQPPASDGAASDFLG